MKFNNYLEYCEAAKKYFASKSDLKVPAEYMILSQEMFDLFNGRIDFGPGYEPNACQKCEHACQQTAQST